MPRGTMHCLRVVDDVGGSLICGGEVGMCWNEGVVMHSVELELIARRCVAQEPHARTHLFCDVRDRKCDS